MNTPSPLVPQGTSPDRGKSKLYFKILMIVSLHVVVIGGLLLQGCKDTKNNSTTASGDTPSTDLTNNTSLDQLPPASNNYAPAVGGAPSNLAATPLPPPYTPPTNPVSAPIQPPPPIAAQGAEGHEYVVTRGDILAVIAKKNGVSLKALKEANPGVEPRKLKIGAKLQIPGGGADVASAGGGTSAGNPGDTGDTSEYVVKSGDMLYRIAKSHGTTVSKIKALNGLKTSSIKVGQKLKLPAPRTIDTAAAPAIAPAAAPMTPPAPYASNATSPTGTK